eukprot:CAMPEP_0172530810 /NCGR_PEP_ID=MMETSP1067-20121228/4433_1 /TAXON_ID=265564 ORGANISM="Thalassiosira punctigera, Strain Tpunct2005C2" /NCGR_SAMPLE_ID=MMETSP1067 /ASSEMBLY_ACC=CAM_ASM_000444 /LENGTH=412 /DNA_ID=CAMNT_0013315089 /DNA_START=223 /DNA_END=1461 /DNA_ORIENTATION=+
MDVEKERGGPEPKTDGTDAPFDMSPAQPNVGVTRTAAAPSALHSSCPAPISNVICPSTFNALSLSSPNVDCEDSKEPPSPSTHPSDIIIAFLSARVDTVELMKSLTSGGGNIARRTANFIARTSNVDRSVDAPGGENHEEDKCDEVSIFSRPELCYEDTDSDEEYSMYDYGDDFTTPDGDNAHDELQYEDVHSSSDGDPSAIKFELSITFQGRKYNATRAFPTFVKLRNDLVRELTVSEGDCRRSKRRSGAKSPVEDICKPMPMGPIPTANDGAANEGVTVPELPRVSPESLGHDSYALSGVARSGFALLQATAQHYCPEMERWMRQVIAAFPCSQSLSRFLWEPLSSSTIGEGGVEENCPMIDLSAFAKRKPRSNKFNKYVRVSSMGSAGSTGTMDSIDEGDGYDSDDHST